MPMKDAHILKFLESSAWAITAPKLEAICAMVSNHALSNMGALREAQIEVMKKREAIDNMRPKGSAPGMVQVVNMFGTMVQRASMMTEISGACSAEQIGAQLRAADADPDVKAIVLNVDSPGGSTCGVPELAALLYGLSTYTVAVCNSTMCSAAYWVGSQADELVITPSGEMGSIGVLAVHLDYSEAYAEAGIKPTIIKTPVNKFEFNSYEPLSEDTIAYAQGQIDTFYEMFTGAVAKGRGVSRSAVKSDAWGKGRTLLAQAAVDAGMADRVATLQDVLTGLGGTGALMTPRRGTRAELATKAEAALPGGADDRAAAGRELESLLLNH